jgi:hypothetical protein
VIFLKENGLQMCLIYKWSQIVTSSWGGMRKLPYAFTEQGVAMLSTVLHSKRELSMLTLPSPKPKGPLGFGRPSDQ